MSEDQRPVVEVVKDSARIKREKDSPRFVRIAYKPDHPDTRKVEKIFQQFSLQVTQLGYNPKSDLPRLSIPADLFDSTTDK